ncbi:MAG: class I SAM-dependent methyltransferase [Acidimicrobiia bacterium]
MNDPWEDLAEWWVSEVASDPSYDRDVVPLLESLLEDLAGRLVLDLGCGEGRVMQILRGLGARVVGCDLNTDLARVASAQGPVIVGRLPGLDYLRDEVFDVVVSVLVLEHLDDWQTLLTEAGRVTAPGGSLLIVLNHPLFTAPGSAPIVDPENGEVLWRWGEYLSEGETAERAGDRSITFYHRPLAHLLNAAAKAGWWLEEAAERPASHQRRAPTLRVMEHQDQIPRLLGVRWRREPFK